MRKYKNMAYKDRKETKQAWRDKNRKSVTEYNRVYQSKNFHRYKKNPKYRFNIYKSGAKARGHSFNLTFDEFMEFWQKPCAYCGNDIETIGLDRVNNKKGYQEDNVVPCCKICNRMKNILSSDEFVNQCNKIIEYRL